MVQTLTEKNVSWDMTFVLDSKQGDAGSSYVEKASIVCVSVCVEGVSTLDYFCPYLNLNLTDLLEDSGAIIPSN